MIRSRAVEILIIATIILFAVPILLGALLMALLLATLLVGLAGSGVASLANGEWTPWSAPWAEWLVDLGDGWFGTSY